MLGGIGATELLIILGIVMILFGAKRVPELAKGLAESIRSFRSALSGRDDTTGGK